MRDDPVGFEQDEPIQTEVGWNLASSSKRTEELLARVSVSWFENDIYAQGISIRDNLDHSCRHLLSRHRRRERWVSSVCSSASSGEMVDLFRTFRILSRKKSSR